MEEDKLVDVDLGDTVVYVDIKDINHFPQVSTIEIPRKDFIELIEQYKREKESK